MLHKGRPLPCVSLVARPLRPPLQGPILSVSCFSHPHLPVALQRLGVRAGVRESLSWPLQPPGPSAVLDMEAAFPTCGISDGSTKEKRMRLGRSVRRPSSNRTHAWRSCGTRTPAPRSIKPTSTTKTGLVYLDNIFPCILALI